MNYVELENLVIQLYENGADIPISALSVYDGGWRFVHIEASPKSVSFWETVNEPPFELHVSSVINNEDWKANYSTEKRLYEGDWRICNLMDMNKEILCYIDSYNGKARNLWNLIQKANYG